jgi:HK97 family phage prohead protease
MNPDRDRGEIVRRSEFRASDGADGQSLEGYAAVFNAWTDITDRQGTYKERIAPGAFKRSIGQRTPVLQFDHGTHPLLGSLPLGSITALREDRNGLFVKAKLSDNWLVEPVRDAIRDGGISGMSFRFRVIKDEWGSDEGGNETRTVQEVELLELGPVVFPAYAQTSVAMRSFVGLLDDQERAELAREAVAAIAPAEARDEDSTADEASAPATDDGPDEPPVASLDNRTRIADALARFRRYHTERPDVEPQ